MLKVLDEVCTPTIGSKYSAAIDLYAREDVVIGVGETKIIPLGICIDLEKVLDGIDSYYPYNEGMLPEYKLDFFMKTNYLQLEPRSSLRAKGLQAGTGIIDMDYKDEIKIILYNPMDIHNLRIRNFQDGISDLVYENDYIIKKGDKIAQIMLKEHKTYLMGISTGDIRVGGLGSTGTK